MPPPSFDSTLPEDFSGQVRLFPLPNLVLFPHVVQALHIFEPRYCDMLHEALATDRLITMALLKPGWESKYTGNPTLAEGVCVGKILTHSPTADDRHNILLAGVRRAKLVTELPCDAPFRRGMVRLLEDDYATIKEESDSASLRADLMGMLGEAFSGQTNENLSKLFSSTIPLGVLADVIAFSAKLPIDKKQELLEQPSVEGRCRVLIQFLKQVRGDGAGNSQKDATGGTLFTPRFPPPFSNN